MMKQISPPYEILTKICSPQKILPDINYVPAAFCLRIPREDGVLLYQTVTGELLLLSEDEEKNLTVFPALRDELIKRRFLVPDGYDEKKHADQIRNLAAIWSNNNTAITAFKIFTTMACNARCFYCYEAGRPQPVMDEKTAHDIAAYIARVSGGEPVKLSWFGGEPLYNRKVIDLITEELCSLGIDYESGMISNGYLFDAELAHRAAEKWKLKRVQITLDGTEDVYNRTKAFIYQEGSAYRRVLRNIGLLLDEGIRVQIRLNMGAQNAEDLTTLVDELFAKFGGREGLSVYTALLMAFDSNPFSAFHDDDAAMEKYTTLQKKLLDCGFARKKGVSKGIATNCCMADSDSTITILPDGRIGKCEHESMENLIGSIYREGFDRDMVKAWKERVNAPACKTCPVYPLCTKLKKCEWNANGCTELMRRIEIEKLREKVLTSFEKLREQNETD